MSALSPTSANAFDDADAPPQRPGWRNQLLRQPIALVSLCALALLALIAIFAPLLAPYDPAAVNPAHRLQGPSAIHWFGADALGRDVLSRVIYGARPALGAAAAAVLIAAAAGVSIGLFVGYRGGAWDRIVMRCADVLQSIPTLVFAFAIIAVIGRGLTPATLAVAFIFSIAYIRITRGVALRERERLYVDAAKVAGLSTPRIIFSEILPNLSGPLIIETSLLLGSAQLVIAMLSFLGLGLDADAPDWGGMLNEARLYQGIHPLLAVPSGLAITLSVLLFNLLGDSLRDIVAGHQQRPHGTRRTRAQRDRSTAAPPSDPSIALAMHQARVEFPLGPNRSLRILDNVSLTLHKGETFGLVGESGSGKSITALAMLGLAPAPGAITAGSVYVNGRDLLGLPDAELARIRGGDIAMIFQDPMAAFSPVHTIGEQMMRPLRAHRNASKAEARDRAIALLSRVGVVNAARRFDDYPHQLSGGMAQRAMIAMALMCEPKILLADEPTTALDVTVQAQVLDLLAELQAEFGMAMLLVTHDLGVVAETCDRVGVMYAGQIVEIGDAHGVFSAPRHPYTRALMASASTGVRRGARLPTIAGRVPPPWAWPSGCRFHPRCAHAVEACRKGDMALVDGVRCARSDELLETVAS